MNLPAAWSCLFSKDNMKRSDGGKGKNIVKAQTVLSLDRAIFFSRLALDCVLLTAVSVVHHRAMHVGGAVQRVLERLK